MVVYIQSWGSERKTGRGRETFSFRAHKISFQKMVEATCCVLRKDGRGGIIIAEKTLTTTSYKYFSIVLNCEFRNVLSNVRLEFSTWAFPPPPFWWWFSDAMKWYMHHTWSFPVSSPVAEYSRAETRSSVPLVWITDVSMSLCQCLLHVTV